MKASGSYPGLPPWVPVSHCDHGSYGDGQNASAVGLTCTTTAFMRLATARSSQARNSACCAAALSPVRLGQSMFATDEIHMALSWRLGVAGSIVQAAAAEAVGVTMLTSAAVSAAKTVRRSAVTKGSFRAMRLKRNSLHRTCGRKVSPNS
jgi:hypothetical protein